MLLLEPHQGWLSKNLKQSKKKGAILLPFLFSFVLRRRIVCVKKLFCPCQLLRLHTLNVFLIGLLRSLNPFAGRFEHALSIQEDNASNTLLRVSKRNTNSISVNDLDCIWDKNETIFVKALNDNVVVSKIVIDFPSSCRFCNS